MVLNYTTTTTTVPVQTATATVTVPGAPPPAAAIVTMRTTVTIARTTTTSTSTRQPTETWNPPPPAAVETRTPFDHTCRPGDANQKYPGGMSLSDTPNLKVPLCELSLAACLVPADESVSLLPAPTGRTAMPLLSFVALKLPLRYHRAQTSSASTFWASWSPGTWSASARCCTR